MTADEIDLVEQILGPDAPAPAGEPLPADPTASEQASDQPAPAVQAATAESTESAPAAPIADSTPASTPPSPDTHWSASDSPAGVAASAAPKRRFHLSSPFRRTKSKAPRRFGPAWFVAAFVVSTLAFLLVFAAVALGLSTYYSTRAVPGVHVGSVDVSGLSRDEVIAC